MNTQIILVGVIGIIVLVLFYKWARLVRSLMVETLTKKCLRSHKIEGLNACESYHVVKEIAEDYISLHPIRAIRAIFREEACEMKKEIKPLKVKKAKRNKGQFTKPH